MKKTVRVTMDIDVSDLSQAQLRENAELGECKVSDLPTIKDLNPGDIADQFVSAVELSEETFAGSDMHIKVTGAKLVSADYI